MGLKLCANQHNPPPAGVCSLVVVWSSLQRRFHYYSPRASLAARVLRTDWEKSRKPCHCVCRLLYTPPIFIIVFQTSPAWVNSPVSKPPSRVEYRGHSAMQVS